MDFIRGRFLLGLFIILLGGALLLNNLNITDISLQSIFNTYWPIVLVFLGLSFMSNKESKGDLFTGIVIILISILLLGRNLGLFYISLSLIWGLFWPAILILIGLSFLFGNRILGKSNLAIMGGIEKKKEPWLFESSSYIAFMGGIELDLTIADIPNGDSILDLTAVMGGIDIIVPRDVEIHCEGVVFLGGLELLDRSTGGIIASVKSLQSGNEGNTKIIKVYSRAIMGGISVKSR